MMVSSLERSTASSNGLEEPGVTHLTQTFSPLSQTFIYDYICELQAQGLPTRVATLERVNARNRPYAAVDIMEPAWNLRRVAHRIRVSLGISTAWEYQRSFGQRALKNLLQSSGAAVVHAHFGPMAVLALPAARQLGIPLVATFYGYDISRLPRQHEWVRAYRAIWEQASAVVVLSEAMKRQVTDLGCPVAKVHIVHLGKRLSDYPFRLRTDRPRRWVSVGRLVEKKGHFDAIHAVRKAINAGADMTLDIIGEGPLRLNLQAYIEKSGLTGRVVLCGARQHDETVQIMAQADAFILCSKTAPDGDQEGTPTVLLEAQALGLPCVSTRHAGVPEMIPTVSESFLAAEGDVSGIAACIQSLGTAGTDRIRAISRAGRAQVEREYELSRETSKLIDLYGRVAC